MAIKKRRTDDDDDFDEDEEEERPRKRKPARKEVDEEDEDRPRKKGKSRDDDDDDKAPARPRKPNPRSKDEDEEEEERPKKRKPKDEEDEDDEEKPRKKKSRQKDEEDEEEKGDEPEEDEDPYEAWIREQAEKRKQLLTGAEALGLYGKRAMAQAFAFLGFVGFGGGWGLSIAFKLLGPDFDAILFWAWLGESLTLGFGVPLMAFSVMSKTSQVPAKMKSSILPMDAMANGVAMILCIVFWLSIFFSPSFYIDGGVAYGWWLVLNLTFVFEQMWFRHVAGYLKDKPTAATCKNGILHFVLVAGIGLPAVGVACYFLNFMGMLGQGLILVVSLVWLLLYVKGLFDVAAITKTLALGCTKKVAAMDKPQW